MVDGKIRVSATKLNGMSKRKGTPAGLPSAQKSKTTPLYTLGIHGASLHVGLQYWVRIVPHPEIENTNVAQRREQNAGLRKHI